MLCDKTVIVEYGKIQYNKGYIDGYNSGILSGYGFGILSGGLLSIIGCLVVKLYNKNN